jgi:MFS family permease
MAEDNREVVVEPVGMFAPLRLGIFRRIWTASLFSNFGTLIQGVGAAWAMTQLTERAEMVALVQSASFAPMMLLSLPAGAIADSYDRRKVALVALTIALGGALGLSVITVLGMLTPVLLLIFCFIVGTGTALFSPAWQASVSEQVPPRALPQAIALNSISYNIARSFGPAIGGVLVALWGVLSAFIFNAFAYLPMITVMYLWRRSPEKSRLPAEALGRAVISGARYAIHSPPIRTVALRTLLVGLIGSATQAMMPLIAHELLKGGATLYGVLLGCTGVGAVVGAMSIGWIRHRFNDERAMSLCLVLVGTCYAAIGLSRSALLTGVLLVISGSGWMVVMAMCNISIQVSSPRWVTGRALAAFSTSICAGVAIGGWAWGHVAAAYGVDMAMVICGILLASSIVFGFVLRMPELEEQHDHGIALTEPDIALDITGRSGPVILTVSYRVPVDKARPFYTAMLEMESIRHRTGAYGWSLSRDIGDPELWIERYHTPTWHDYLRQRDRLTAADMAAWDRARAFHKGPDPIRFNRLLERPYGSVRWSEDVPDRGVIVPLPQQGS